MIPGGAARPPHSNYDGGSGQGRARAKLSGVRLAFANLALVGLALIGAGPGLGLACCAACCAAVCGAGCGAKPADDSPVGVVKRLVAAVDDRDQGAAFELLGPETRARLKAAAARANALGGGKPRLVPKEMLSLAWRSEAEADWKPKSFKLLGVEGEVARVEVSGASKGQRQVVRLVKVKGHWRVELGAPPSR